MGESGRNANRRSLAELIRANIDRYKLQYQRVLASQKALITEGQEKIPIAAAADNVLYFRIERTREKEKYIYGRLTYRNPDKLCLLLFPDLELVE